ncbi:MAG TPA: SDR family NAD(P)-dependent oxidoreductase, partial [Steroidobacteraceae bacterium]
AALPCYIVDLDRNDFAVDALGGRFDIVVLGEGLADSTEPARRLLNARRLLLNHGLLAVLEQHTSRAADLVYGMDPNWWLKNNDDLAVRSRLRTPEVWRGAMAAAGFDEIETVHDTPDAPTGPYLLIARAGATPQAAARPRPAPARTWLLLHDVGGYSADLSAALALKLEQQGQHVVTVLAAADYACDRGNRYSLDPGASQHWDLLFANLREAGSEPHGWIHLAGLDLETAKASADTRAAVQEFRAAALMHWLQACTRHAKRPDCWIVAAQAGLALLPPAALQATTAASDRGAGVLQPDRLRDAPLWGMTRVGIQEFRDQRIRWVDLADPLPCALAAARLAQEMLDPDAEDEIILQGAGRYVPRLGVAVAPPRPAAARESRPHVYLDCSVPGPFRNLRWQPGVDPGPLAEDELEIDVRAAGLNFRDVMYAMGLLPDEAVENGFCGPTLGMEVSGVVARVGAGVNHLAQGDPVIAFAPASFSDRVRTRALAVTRKPGSWSFAAAATVPTAFFTAYYALHELAHLRAGERVLIHGAAGGVGIAAIQVAKHLGAEIIATAGTDEKRDFVRLLGADLVFDSRSTAFADEILRATGGTGVDVVLNSLAGEAITRNLHLLRPFGRMLELGKRDFYENSRVGLRPFRNNIAYFGIDADQLIAQRPTIARRIFVDLMALFADGTLHPLPYRTFYASDIATAFRHMQASRHIGKIVVDFPDQFDLLGAHTPEPAPVQLRSDATYLVTGGLSGFGLRTAAWLVRHGARHLALLSRRGVAATPEAEQQLAEFAAAGVSIMAPACDVADESVLVGTLAVIDAQMPPLRGVVHAAMVIEDALIRDISREQLHRVLAPKIRGAMHLHEATRNRALDFFLLYSSATTLFGNPGQAAYVAANTALEALAAERRALGLPATCVAWGPIGDAGYLARNERVREVIVGRVGGHALTSDGALAALETLWGADAGNIGYLDLDWSKTSRFLPTASSPKFSDLARLTDAGERGMRSDVSAEELRRWLNGLGAEERSAALTEILRAELAEILRIAPERIEPGASLLDMGMDSLMAVELATSIEMRLGIEFSVFALSGGPTIENIVERVLRMLHSGGQLSDQAPGDAALAAQVQVVAARHAGEVSDEVVTEFTAEMRAAASPRPLTGGRHT